jgi:hypothetical protein
MFFENRIGAVRMAAATTWIDFLQKAMMPGGVGAHLDVPACSGMMWRLLRSA